MSKSDRNPIEYYDMRVAEGVSLLYYERDEFIDFLNKMTKPFSDKWPKHYAIASQNVLEEEGFKDILTELLYGPVDITASSTKYNHESSVNWPIWQKVIARSYETYKPLTAKDVEGRIGFANERFEINFGADKKISDISLSELKKFINDILVLKYESKNEISKFRMLIKMLIEVMNEEIMSGQLDDLYSEVPTYSKIMVE